MRVAPEHYDVIVADNFHPARSGSGSLYTVEHFAAVRDRLAAGGVFCQWLPLHQLDLDTLRSIVRSYLAVFPHGSAMLATNSLDTPVVGLVARRAGERFDVERIRQRLASWCTASARRVRHRRRFRVARRLHRGPGSLVKFAGDAPLNTDDRPVVAYQAPRITYAPTSAPRDRLLELLPRSTVNPPSFSERSDPVWQRRLAAYWAARDRYLESGRDVRPTSDVRDMLAQVREPLLSVLQISPDFRPAYDPLLRMAQGIAASDSAAARELLAQLEHEQPARPEAREALRAMSASR